MNDYFSEYCVSCNSKLNPDYLISCWVAKPQRIQALACPFDGLY